jgi:hypothetical protein
VELADSTNPLRAIVEIAVQEWLEKQTKKAE